MTSDEKQPREYQNTDRLNVSRLEDRYCEDMLIIKISIIKIVKKTSEEKLPLKINGSAK